MTMTKTIMINSNHTTKKWYVGNTHMICTHENIDTHTCIVYHVCSFHSSYNRIISGKMGNSWSNNDKQWTASTQYITYTHMYLCMYVCMNVRMNEWMNEWMNECKYVYVYVYTFNVFCKLLMMNSIWCRHVAVNDVQNNI